MSLNQECALRNQINLDLSGTSRITSTKELKIIVSYSTQINKYLGKLFNSFVFVKTYIFVAHGKFLSLFDVLKQKWMKHLVFDADILTVFRQKDDEEFDICVLQIDGKIKFINQRNNPGTEDYTLDESIEFQIQGKILTYD